MSLLAQSDWVTPLLTVLTPLLAGIGAAIAAGAHWWVKRKEAEAERQRAHELQLAERMDDMCNRHESAEKACQAERREMTDKVIDCVTDMKVVVQGNTAAIEKLSGRADELHRKIDEQKEQRRAG